MSKVILIDGNNLIFRSYYATAYSGSILKNSKGLPTNALYGFVGMINKIIEEEKPEYLMVAFDIGKNFRKEKYDFYKEGRHETPEELKVQMPIAREILTAMGIKYLELAPYEADDIIGTVASIAEDDPNFETLIVSSDKDLLQLISDETEIKLLKQSGYIKYNKKSFIDEWGIEPINIIDLKALMGDSSDNIPGVKGIGEKTALKLLQEYKTLDGIYENIDKITGKTQEKLIVGKNDAYMSYEIATIYRSVPIDVSFESFKYSGPNYESLKKMYEELEFYSMIKTIDKKNVSNEDNNYIVVDDINKLDLDDKIAIYLEVDNSNYHLSNPLALSITDKNNTYIVPKDLINDTIDIIKDKEILTYDLKKILVVLKSDIKCEFDLMIAAYLINESATLDIEPLASNYGIYVLSYQELSKNNFDNLYDNIAKKSKFIYEYSEKINEEVIKTKQDKILNDIEMPLIYVLSSMEKNGFKYDSNNLSGMKKEVKEKIEILDKEIKEMAGCDFNISSPKQLGEVLFERMNIGTSKKINRGYKTDIKTLQKFQDKHPIINKILEYRNLTKLQNTYLEGLESFVLSDGCIHTIFNQTLTRTGRLSSMEPNLQNIPVREEYGKKIRLAFVPSNDLILSADYSQIELRILAHISTSKDLINAFINDEDIHTKVAADIHGINESMVTKEMRSMAKAVIFGIVYGISGYGLSSNLNISSKDAKMFINKYYELYPGVKNYMDNIIKEAYSTGEVKTLFGRVRKIEELKDLNYNVRSMGERMALNTPIQGTSADIMKMAMIEVYNRIKEKKLKSKMILQIHDEILIDATKDEIDILKILVKDAMENVVSLSVPLKVEISTGINWYEAK